MQTSWSMPFCSNIPASRTRGSDLRFTIYDLRAIVAAIALAVSTAHGVAEQPQPKPTFHPTLAAASEVAAADQSLVLLDFSAEWCGPCRAMKKNTFPAKEFVEGAGAVRIAVVDIDANPKMAQSFKVSAVPTLVLLTPDSKIVSRHTGA